MLEAISNSAQMPRQGTSEPLPLIGGFYQSKSINANSQRCVNLYPEKNPEDAPFPYTMMSTPGLSTLGNKPSNGTWRGLYTATNGNLFGVLGQIIYFIDPNFTFTPIGQLGKLSNGPVGMVDNGTFLVIVDGSNQGYTVNLATNAFAVITDLNFQGGTHVDIVDGFLVLDVPSSRSFYSSLNFKVQFDGTYTAQKSGFPDPIAALIVMNREIMILGTLKTSEIWYNAGGAAFPFALTPGVFIQHGCIAPFSVATHDKSIYFLGCDKDGDRAIFEYKNYQVRKISHPGIGLLLRDLAVVKDAIAMMYRLEDHTFYQLTLPTADLTINWDLNEELWHTRSFLDVNGIEHRHRANCMATAYGKIICGDFQNGNLYQLDPNSYTDFGNPILRRRSFSHILAGGKRFSTRAFWADIEVGNAFPLAGSPWSSGFSSGFGPAAQGAADNVYLKWSTDRGRTFGNPVPQRLGPTGAYIGRPTWRNLGMAHDLLMEIFWAANTQASLLGGWIEVDEADA
jgi:hypothetical protein